MRPDRCGGSSLVFLAFTGPIRLHVGAAGLTDNQCGREQLTAWGQPWISQPLQHGPQSSHGDFTARLVNRGEGLSQQGGISNIVEASEPNVLRDTVTLTMQGPKQLGGGVIVGAKKCIPVSSSHQAAHEAYLCGITEMDPAAREFEMATGDGRLSAGDPGVDGRGRIRPGDKGKTGAAQLEKMFRKQEAGSHVVQAHEVEVAPLGKGPKVTVDEDDGHACEAEPFGDLSVGLLPARDQLERGEENAIHPPFNELVADLSCLFETQVGIMPRMLSTTPQQTEILGPGHARQLAADQFEYFRASQTGNQQAQLTAGTGRRCLGTADKTARTHPPLDKAGGLEILECSDHCRPGHTMLPDQLGLAGQPRADSKMASEDRLLQFPGDPPVFRLRFGHDTIRP